MVTSRTAKQFRAVEAEDEPHQSTYEHRVATSKMGDEWFATEREAWERRAAMLRDEIRGGQESVQRSRSALGRVESILNGLGKATSAESQLDAVAVDPHVEVQD